MRKSELHASHTKINGQQLTVFNQSWLDRAQAWESDDSWADAAMETMATGGRIYLALLRVWFGRYPLSNKQKRHLKVQLESFVNEDHLGAVNELVWWEFMQKIGIKTTPIPTSGTPQPDFMSEIQGVFFVEISTLNPSESDKKKFETGQGVELDHQVTLRRFLRKIMEEKRGQMSYAAKQGSPFVLVLFDYTTWSGFGTQFFRFLKEGLGSEELPVELSALIYVDRMVEKGRIGINRDRSAVYYNLNAKYPLFVRAFTILDHFRCQMVNESNSSDPWVWLA
jgi:hypothetical protein